MSILHLNLKTRLSFDRVHMPWCRFPKQYQLFWACSVYLHVVQIRNPLQVPARKIVQKKNKGPKQHLSCSSGPGGFAETNGCSHSSTTMNCVSPAPCNLPVSIVTWCCYTNTHGAGEDWDSNQLVWSIFKTKQLLSSSISTAENSLLWFNFIFSWRACWRKAKLNKYFFCIVFWMLWLFE